MSAPPSRERTLLILQKRSPEWASVMRYFLCIMRTTVSLDEDVVARIESERQSRGESFRVAINRMLRGSAQRRSDTSPPLPLLSGTPRIDITDVSAALAKVGDEHLLGKGLY